MNWSRAKTILIVMFLLINCFLLYLYFSSLWGHDTTDEKTIHNIVTIVNKNGISIEAKIVPKRHKDMKEINGTSSVIDNGIIYKQLLKNEWTVSDFILRKGDTETFEINGDQFVYTNSKNVETTGTKEAEYIAKKFLYQNGVKKDIRIINTTKQTDCVEIKFAQYFGEFKIFNSEMNVIVEKNTVTKWSGSYYDIQEDRRKSEYSIAPAINALMDFLKDNNVDKTIYNNISSFETGYYFSNVGQPQSSAVPVYKIISNNRSFYYDARSNE